jgi:death on curing protein
LRPDLEDVLFFHTVCIELYGGAGSVRDEGSLEAAVARPWLVVQGVEAFPSPYTKAAAICESIIRRHPFVDGNKRTAVSAAAYLLERHGIELTATPAELEEFAVTAAESHTSTSELVRWFDEHTEKGSER